VTADGPINLSDFVNIHAGLRQAAQAVPIPPDEDEEIAEEDLEAPSQNKQVFEGFYENLAADIGEYELSSIASDLLRGIEADIQSRQDWENSASRAVDLLGLKMEDATGEISGVGTISKVYHPLLLEAVVRYQANARGELLPSNGPVKVRDDQPVGPMPVMGGPMQPGIPQPGVGPAPANPMMGHNGGPGLDRDVLAEAFEKDFNHYLTVVAKEYYPDFDRMLFSMALIGCAFRKIYHCPLKRRPVSEFVPAYDLIVSNDATDLYGAGRVTHRVKMRHSTLRRMQVSGVYLDEDLGQPNEQISALDQKIKSIEGLMPQPQLPADHRHTIYECYVELDLKDFPGEDGIPLPYRVTIDKDSQQILEIRRNWKEEDQDFQPLRRFVKYGMIPGLGFYDYGYIQLLGNTTRALTAIERQLLDAGQFANFPGFLISKMGMRQNTNQIRVQPGGGHEIDTGGLPINAVAMPLPYKEPSVVLMQLGQSIAQDGMRLAGSAELPVGEGTADIPVGTMIAMIEQSTKVLDAVHKRNHTSQQEEFEIMRDLFKEDPTALWRFAKNPARKWQEAEEFQDIELVPAADPNTPSHIHRIMQAQALLQLSSQAPQLYNVRTVHEKALRVLGIEDPDSLFNPLPPPPGTPGAMPPPPQVPPQVLAEQAKGQTRAAEQQRELQQNIVEGQIKMQELNATAQLKAADNAAKERLATMKMAGDQQKTKVGFLSNLMKRNQGGLNGTE
jgi:hypothetical protein